MADNRSDDDKAKDVSSTLEYLAEIRRHFEPMIDDILTYVTHSRRKIYEVKSTRGVKTGHDVFDGSAMSAINMLVDGMVGYLCSRNQRWFRFSLPGKWNFPVMSGMRSWSGKRMDEYPEVRQWLEDCAEVQYTALTRSNFYDVIPEFIRDGAGPGTAHILSEEDVGKGRISFTVPHFRECFIAENQFGRVDTNYRVYSMTLRQLVDKFGYEVMVKADKEFKKAYESNQHADKEIIHAIYPRKDYDPKREDGASKPVASLWVLREPLALLSEKGYDWMPSITWRWRKNSDEWYGRSPSWDAFIEIMKANQQARSNLIAAHKMIEPPMIAPSSLRGQVQYGPKGQTFIDGDLNALSPRPMVTGIQLPYGLDALERTQKIIAENYAVPFFMALTMAAADKVEMTATQVVEMMGEKAAILGTRVGQLQSEGLDPIHDRVFDIEARAGRMPQPPEILMEHSGGRIEVQYLGPLAQAQMRLSKLRSLQSGLMQFAQIASIAPQALDRIDWDMVSDVIVDSTGFPETCIRSEQEMNAIRKKRAEDEQAQQQVEALGPMAKMLRAGNTKPEHGSPAQQLLNPEQEPEPTQPGA